MNYQQIVRKEMEKEYQKNRRGESSVYDLPDWKIAERLRAINPDYIGPIPNDELEHHINTCLHGPIGEG